MQPKLTQHLFCLSLPATVSHHELEWKHFTPETILWWLYCYGSTLISDAHVMPEREISVDRSTRYQWFIEYASALCATLRRYLFIDTDSSWQ